MVTGRSQERDPISNDIIIYSEVYSNILIHCVIVVITIGHSSGKGGTVNRCKDMASLFTAIGRY